MRELDLSAPPSHVLGQQHLPLLGRRNFKSSDESRNVWLLSLISFGESWHNNDHAFPSSAFHGLRRFDEALDPGGWVITGLEKPSLAWKVVRITRERQAPKSLVA